MQQGRSRIKAKIPRYAKRQIIRMFQNIRDGFVHNTIRKRVRKELRHIVFVCKGNICRSAFSEYYFKKILSDMEIIIESCGLDCDQGSFAPTEAVAVGNEFGLDLSAHRSRRFDSVDLSNADLIVAMEYRHLQQLMSVVPHHRENIYLLRDFAMWPMCHFPNIYDPYGLGEKEFRKCFLRMKCLLDRLNCRISLGIL